MLQHVSRLKFFTHSFSGNNTDGFRGSETRSHGRAEPTWRDSPECLFFLMIGYRADGRLRYNWMRYR
jgi:hypothetical protein